MLFLLELFLSLQRLVLLFNCWSNTEPGHAADQHHFADLTGGEAGILQRLAAGLDGLLDEIVDQRLELGARQLHRQMLRTGRIGRDERQVDLGRIITMALVYQCHASQLIPPILDSKSLPHRPQIN
jgi:hypothetical protein